MNIQETVESSSKHLLNLALGLSFICYSLAFYRTLLHYFGLTDLNLFVLLSHPNALFELLFEAFGGSLLPPSLHVAIASIFKSKRNSNTRRRIFIGWSIFIISLQVLTILLNK